jgi:rare lipoprotein A
LQRLFGGGAGVFTIAPGGSDLEFDAPDLAALDLLIAAAGAAAGPDSSAALSLRTFRRELTHAAFMQAVRVFDGLPGPIRGAIAGRAYAMAHQRAAAPPRSSRRDELVARFAGWCGMLRARAARALPAGAPAMRFAPLLVLALFGRDGVPESRLESPAPSAAAVVPVPAPARDGQTGVASWYGRWHHGKQTANGERFDMNAMTAAHRDLPLASRIRVTNLENGRLIEVKVNDRGPYVDGRVLDLSARAADELGMRRQGLAKVKIEPIN